MKQCLIYILIHRRTWKQKSRVLQQSDSVCCQYSKERK